MKLCICNFHVRPSACPWTQFYPELPLLNHSPFCDQNLLHYNALAKVCVCVGGGVMITFCDSSSCDRIHSSLTPVSCFDNGYVGKQPVVWKEYCVEYRLKELQESMDRCTGRPYISEILFKTAFNTIQEPTASWRCVKPPPLSEHGSFIYFIFFRFYITWTKIYLTWTIIHFQIHQKFLRKYSVS